MAGDGRHDMRHSICNLLFNSFAQKSNLYFIYVQITLLNSAQQIQGVSLDDNNLARCRLNRYSIAKTA